MKMFYLAIPSGQYKFAEDGIEAGQSVLGIRNETDQVDLLIRLLEPMF